MNRLVNFMGRRAEEVVKADMTGGTIQAIKLTDNHVPKVLLGLTKNGVQVEMALTEAQAADFADELAEAIAWVREGGRRV